MASVLASLVVQLSANTAALDKSLKQSQANAQGFGKAMGDVGKIAGGIIVAEGLMKLPGLLTSGISAAQSLASSISKLGRETGLTAEESSKLIFAFEHYGLSAADASKSLGILAKKLKGVSDEETGVVAGGKSTAAILADLGIKATNAAGGLLPMGVILPQVADVFKKMPDGIEKTGLAMQLFGKSGKDMIPVLNQGSEGLVKLGLDAEKLGVVMDEKAVRAAKNLTYAQRDMHEAMKGLQIMIGTAIIPTMTDLTTKFTETLVAIRPLVQEGIEKLGAALHTVQTIIEKVHLDDFAADSNATKIALVALALIITASVIPAMIKWTATTWTNVTALVAQKATMFGPLGLIAALGAVAIGLGFYIDKNRDAISTIPILGKLVSGHAQYQRDLNAALAEANDLYERQIISLDELGGQKVQIYTKALVDLGAEFSDVTAGSDRWLTQGLLGIDLISEAGGNLIKDMQRGGATWEQVLAALTQSGIDWKNSSIKDVLDPMSKAWAEERLTAIFDTIAATYKKDADAMVVANEELAKEIADKTQKIIASIQTLLPATDQTFEEWKKKVEDMYSAWVSFDANLRELYTKLTEASVDNVDEIVRATEQGGPLMAQAAVDMLDQGTAALDVYRKEGKQITIARQYSGDIVTTIETEGDRAAQAMGEYARAMIQEFDRSLGEETPKAITAIQGMSADMIVALQGSPRFKTWYWGQEMGSDLSEGVVLGIERGAPAMIDAMGAAAVQLMQAANSGAGGAAGAMSHGAGGISGSMAEAGAAAASGLMRGFVREVEDSEPRTSDDVSNSLRSAMASFTGEALNWGKSIAEYIMSGIYTGFSDNFMGYAAGIARIINDNIQSALGSAGAAISGAGGAMGVPALAGGGYINRSGLAFVHAGETVVPARSGGGDTNIYLKVQGSILSERDLESLIADAMRRGRFRGL